MNQARTLHWITMLFQIFKPYFCALDYYASSNLQTIFLCVGSRGCLSSLVVIEHSFAELGGTSEARFRGLGFRIYLKPPQYDGLHQQSISKKVAIQNPNVKFQTCIQ